MESRAVPGPPLRVLRARVPRDSSALRLYPQGAGPGPHTVMKTGVSESVRNALGGRVENKIKTGRQQN